jgi:hypothetical protein
MASLSCTSASAVARPSPWPGPAPRALRDNHVIGADELQGAAERVHFGVLAGATVGFPTARRSAAACVA